jgi:hypothetical protein
LRRNSLVNNPKETTTADQLRLISDKNNRAPFVSSLLPVFKGHQVFFATELHRC